MIDEPDFSTEPDEHTYLVAARCKRSGGDVTKEYGFVDAETPTAAAAIAKRIWEDYDRTPLDSIYVADTTGSFDVSEVDAGDDST